MIFGRTTEQIQNDYNKKSFDKIFGIRKFAFFPVMLDDGRYIWLEYYWKANCFVFVKNSLYVRIFSLTTNHRYQHYHDWNISSDQKEAMDLIKENYQLFISQMEKI